MKTRATGIYIRHTSQKPQTNEVCRLFNARGHFPFQPCRYRHEVGQGQGQTNNQLRALGAAQPTNLSNTKI